MGRNATPTFSHYTRGNDHQFELRLSINMHLRHTAVAHISTSFSQFPLSERLKGYVSRLKGRSKRKSNALCDIWFAHM